MSAEQLIEAIEDNEYILPKDFLDRSSEDELIAEIEEIFKRHKTILDNKPDFKEKYIELVNYMYFWTLTNKKHAGKKIFDQKLIDYLTSSTSTD